MSKGWGRGRKKTVRKKAGRRRSKKTEEGDNYLMWGRRRNGLTNNFTLAVYRQFLVAADSTVTTFEKNLPQKARAGGGQHRAPGPPNSPQPPQLEGLMRYRADAITPASPVTPHARRPLPVTGERPHGQITSG